jgi:hypothetical protein
MIEELFERDVRLFQNRLKRLRLERPMHRNARMETGLRVMSMGTSLADELEPETLQGTAYFIA